jgi:class 3 adenylate cyclase
MSGDRLEYALAAFLRQELGASVAAITGFIDILLDDARTQGLDHVVRDLARMREAADQLSALIEVAVMRGPPAGPSHRVSLRHDIRTPLNAIKGYGELLVEEAGETGAKSLLPDLRQMLTFVDRLLGEIDRTVELVAAPPIDIVGNLLQGIRPLVEDDVSRNAVSPAKILLVDDNASNRDLLSRRLAREGYQVTAAADGATALALAATAAFDLVLLDLMMPGMSGFEVLRRLKADAATQHVPVIMISALDELDSTVRCIEAGAEDYLHKPFNPVLLRARIGASLEKKRLLDELRVEKERSEALLMNILPRSIVERMRRGETVIADHIADATILFCDLVDFTALAGQLSPEQTVAVLADVFCRFDDLAARYGLEKIKTTGDGYMVAGGLPEPRTDHATAAAEMALGMVDAIGMAGTACGVPLQVRIGLHTGALIAGVLGTHKFVYDVWGDTVNTAKRMESYGLPGRIHVSVATREALAERFQFEPRGRLDIKGKGPVETYFLCGPGPPSALPEQ